MSNEDAHGDWRGLHGSVSSTIYRDEITGDWVAEVSSSDGRRFLRHRAQNENAAGSAALRMEATIKTIYNLCPNEAAVQ